MNTSSKNRAIAELNAAVAKIYKSMTALSAAEAVFWFHENELIQKTVSGEFVEILVAEYFGDLNFGLTQKIVLPPGACPGSSFTVQLPCFLTLPDVLKNIFANHADNLLFDAPFKRLGLAIEISVYWYFYDEEYVPLNRSTTDLSLDAFTESYFHTTADKLLRELDPYGEWLEYFEQLASGRMELERRKRLIADAKLILAYIYEDGVLNFSKLTGLCDVAGSLQPVRSLIQKDMPDLLG